MKRKIAYCTPSLYIPGGIERVLTVKANYLADVMGYDVYMVLTDGKGKEPYYPLSPKVHLIQLNINFDELWRLSFVQKIPVYLKKQRVFKKKLKEFLFEIRPDITVSVMRREINFITSIKDGSVKLGELQVNRLNYRNFEANNTNFLTEIFSKFWMQNLVRKLKALDRFIVLTHEDKDRWVELNDVRVIPNLLFSYPDKQSDLSAKKVIAAGRYVYQKGFDLLLKAWVVVAARHPDWTLCIYGGGEPDAYIQQAAELNIKGCCHIEKAVQNIVDKHLESSVFVLSSRFEGLPLALIEAMACGLPVVSFACPCGPRDVIKDGVDGFLVEKDNVKKLAEKICYLIENEAVRKEMGRKARVNAERFKIESVMKQWTALFDEVLREREVL